MKLFNFAILFIIIGVSCLIAHCILELLSMVKIKIWLKKNKEALLKNEQIYSKYSKNVLSSDEYKQLKEIYDENLFLINTFAQVGLNYTDFLFFQGLISEYQPQTISKCDKNSVFSKVKRLVWIMFFFEISLYAKRIGWFMSKLSIVYSVVLCIYMKLLPLL